MKTADIRRTYLDFFEKRGHTVVPSAPLVYNDPTLLFVNAGMVPFKPYFIGDEVAPFDRAVSSQKCVRTLDIEEVGKTTRHGTFFQMLGNFSFGDYFKEGAIEYAWELVTSPQDQGGFGFDGDRIWTTVLTDDDEAFAMWRAVGMPAEHIQRRGIKDNYWHMGVPGPGGPCSEIYIDRGPQYGPDGGPEADEDRFLEIWNLVFQTQDLIGVRSKTDFDVAGDLPKKNIDTGAGLERIAYLLQGKQNMYEIDEVWPVIERAAELAGKTYGKDHGDDVRLRVVGDHVRSGLMLMSDGVSPGNEARGYVLRRLLRRAIRAMRLLGVHDPVLSELLPISRDLMKVSWPDVATNWARISDVAYAEEDTFRRTLTAGTQIFDVAVRRTKESGQDTLSGTDAFQLHDTYGFPIDLTLEMAEEQGLTVDRKAFQSLMQEQRDRAKADARAKKGGMVSTDTYRELRAGGETAFTGYDELVTPSIVRGVVRDGRVVPEARPGETVEVVLAETPFYAESGGQDADLGIITGDGLHLDVLDVQRPVPGLVVHTVRVGEGELHTGQTVDARVDADHRFSSRQAHSATHLVHAALRELVGPSAVQAGSYNKPGYLRFDFNSTQALSKDLQQAIEGRTMEAIHDDLGVSTTMMNLDDAKQAGAMAMFGEKYPDRVRVVQMGSPWSLELCGGTHVSHTSQIGLVAMTGESSIGSGIRRVEFLVGSQAFDHFAAERQLVQGLADSLRTQPEQLADRVARMAEQLKAAEKEIAAYRAKELLATAGAFVDRAVRIGGVTLVAETVAEVAPADLRTLATEIRGRLGENPAVVALVSGTQKPAAVVATTAAAREAGLRAGDLIRVACAELGGKGGGKPDLAQGGGTDPAGAPRALAVVKAAVEKVGATR
ncbi:alanine--tRNA ligase [Raineyella fluvialis]|uniref:Alanine--tRNA ligase n=1 Tax=Raineyella fluvialis TaxID=2662261 RepID=A0A5Q2FG72_9ACTN|nr:alanine--tRNA ligase [Raineyella fluvialis]QGF24524.1 alanine--tRNA ligase [Raineyella fluvialis]